MSNAPEPQTYSLPPAAPPNNEGSTPAAWTMFWAITIGLLIAVVGFALQQTIVLVAGLVVIAVGLAISWGMRMSGLGQPVRPRRDRSVYGEPV